MPTCYRHWWLVLGCVIVNVNIAVIILTLSPASSVNSKTDDQPCRLSVQTLDKRVQRETDRDSPNLPENDALRLNTFYKIRNSNASSTASKNPLVDLMPLRLREMASGLPVTITAEEFRSSPKVLTGNPLIDTYGEGEGMLAGEMGRGVVFAGAERDAAEALLKDLNLNVLASDVIPLNRRVPDSRIGECIEMNYAVSELTVSIVVPFHNEWPSVLLRTVYSVVNRTPRNNLLEILLVDDDSDMESLGKNLEEYLRDFFPRELVRLLRMPERAGLIRARMAGFKASTGDVIVFLDSHMEVNTDWLQPLLAEIEADRHNVAMAVLDYVDAKTLQYNYNRGFAIRYGFDWRLFFFETLPKPPQGITSPVDPYPGVVMVGSAFAIDRKYFEQLAGYDVGMEVWGGENIELSWKIWMCGGRLLHVPCSHVGHIARQQPYTFPAGRHMSKLRNYKRAAEVWMGPYTRFLYENFPEVENVDVGDLRDRRALRDALQCHDFTWYLDNVWPHLTVYDRDVIAWGSAVNKKSGRCLDNHLFMGPLGLYTATCHFHLNTQGFSLTEEGLLRTTLHCVVVKNPGTSVRPTLEDCVMGSRDKWHHLENGHVVHADSGLCLDEDDKGPVMTFCHNTATSQRWRFTKYVTVDRLTLNP